MDADRSDQNTGNQASRTPGASSWLFSLVPRKPQLGLTKIDVEGVGRSKHLLVSDACPAVEHLTPFSGCTAYSKLKKVCSTGNKQKDYLRPPAGDPQLSRALMPNLAECFVGLLQATSPALGDEGHGPGDQKNGYLGCRPGHLESKCGKPCQTSPERNQTPRKLVPSNLGLLGVNYRLLSSF